MDKSNLHPLGQPSTFRAVGRGAEPLACPPQSILDLGNTNVNIYVGCDSNDPTASFIRTILIDDSDTYGITYDFPLSASADWSTVLEEWVFMTTSVSPSMVALMVDGEDKSSGDLFSCCLEAKGTTMTQDFTGFTFVTDIYVGARADENADRHYAGKVRAS